jgi:hypothetical protein
MERRLPKEYAKSLRFGTRDLSKNSINSFTILFSDDLETAEKVKGNNSCAPVASFEIKAGSGS